ncbi:LETM1-related biofilm-associated protein [Robertkochia aurantiaca]|uniref:LETM1-related biofilm-associated protein n=1 Tax=Robertkochia aurantiaca TaxID=2873700 RepID=UPI001CCA23DF|nr:LETM1-related biofilm-associated protein [Robertkochia sp. 3YJGBD-33]
MNPSAQGWIDKLGRTLTDKPIENIDLEGFYPELRSLGFIYGSNIAAPSLIDTPADLTADELAKINLVTALFVSFRYHQNSADTSRFLEALLDFYNEVNTSHQTFFDRLIPEKKISHKLERLIHRRVEIDDNLFTRSFNPALTNSLLFIDVLGFDRYLRGNGSPTENTARMERVIMTLTYRTLRRKKHQTAYDAKLLRLFEASVYYQVDFQPTDTAQYLRDLNSGFNTLEKKYLLDLAAMASWTDTVSPEETRRFVSKVASLMRLDLNAAHDSLENMETFYSRYRDRALIFNNAHPIQQFYDNSTQLVRKLINRNKKRLIKEISNSRELLYLISKSAQQELSPEEKKRMKNQLLDIFKTIPSLAIFALPGGAILLPIFVKLIPSLLPSAFDDNRIEKEL